MVRLLLAWDIGRGPILNNASSPLVAPRAGKRKMSDVGSHPKDGNTQESPKSSTGVLPDWLKDPISIFFPDDPDPDGIASETKLVVIESPYGGSQGRRNVAYARACLLDSLERGESPMASHLLYTQVLDDLDSDEREAGIEAGHAWYAVVDACVVYVDYGITDGMLDGMDAAQSWGVPIEFRSL